MKPLSWFLSGAVLGGVVGRLRGVRLGHDSAVQFFITEGCEPTKPLTTGWKWR